MVTGFVLPGWLWALVMLLVAGLLSPATSRFPWGHPEGLRMIVYYCLRQYSSAISENASIAK
jgi:hypothetical protein